MQTRPLQEFTQEEVDRLLAANGRIYVLITRYGRFSIGIIKLVKRDEYIEERYKPAYSNYYHVFSSGNILDGGWNKRIKSEAFDGYEAAYAICSPFDYYFLSVIINPTLYDLL